MNKMQVILSPSQLNQLFYVIDTFSKNYFLLESIYNIVYSEKTEVVNQTSNQNTMMDNMSGNPAQWAVDTPQKLNKPKLKKRVKQSYININPDIKDLKSIIKNLDKTYKKNPSKDLYDALTDLKRGLSSLSEL